MNKLILAAAVLSASVSTQGVFAANDDNNGKVSVCHNGRTVSINSSGLRGHLGHGDRWSGRIAWAKSPALPRSTV